MNLNHMIETINILNVDKESTMSITELISKSNISQNDNNSYILSDADEELFKIN